MKQDRTIRVGTRGSLLALAQTEQVITTLQGHYPELNIEKVVISTQGDRILDRPLVDFGGKGVFVEEFETALAKGRIDLAVHSAKDMPMKLMDGLMIAGVLPRGDARDVLVTGKEAVQNKMMKVGTGSLRRRFQLEGIYPQAQCVPIRGNVTTRLQKLRDDLYDGIVLAAAGLERLSLLGQQDLEYRYFSYEEMVPAGGQGIIAIEGREDDEISSLVRNVSDSDTELELETERRILELLQADCHEAVGVFSEISGGGIVVSVVRSINGKIYKKREQTTVEMRLKLAERLAEEMIAYE